MGKLIKSLGPDDNLEIERFNTSYPAPKKNVQKDYFNNVIKEYAGIAKVKKDKLDKCIDTIKKYLGKKDKCTTHEVREFVNCSRDIPKKLVNMIVKTFNGKNELNELSYEEMQTLRNLYSTFNHESIEVLGKNVKYKQNILFHLLGKIVKKPDMNDFYFQASESVERTEKEIKKLFDKLGWKFTPM